MKLIKRKITIIGEDFEFSFIKDYTKYAIDLIKNKTNKLNESNIYDFFKEGEFNDNEIKNLNGVHFLFGFLEALGQSEDCPEKLFTYDKPLKYKIKKIN